MASDVLCGKRTLVRRVRGLVVVGLGRRVCFTARDFSIGRASVFNRLDGGQFHISARCRAKGAKVTEYGLAGAFPPFQSLNRDARHPVIWKREAQSMQRELPRA